MSIDLVNKIRLLKLPPTAKFILWLLADHTNGKTKRCDPSIATLSNESGFHPSTVKHAIAALEQAGVIEVLRSNGNRNQYVVTSSRERPVAENDRLHTTTGPVAENDRTGSGARPEPEEPEENRLFLPLDLVPELVAQGVES